MAEALHGLGIKGKVELARRGFTAEGAPMLPRHVEHLIGINDIRVAVETATPHVRYCLASWEMQALGWGYSAVPDLVAGLQSPERTCFYFEYDRGTEGLATFARKLRWYASDDSAVRFAALVLVVDAESRMETLGRKVRELACLRPIAGCVLSELSQSGIEARIFTDLRKPSLKTSLLELAE